MKLRLQDSPLVNVLLFSVFWAIQVFISKLAFNAGAPVMPFTVQSLIFSIGLLGLYIIVYKRKQLGRIPRAALVGLIFASGVHGGIGGFLSNVGVSLTSGINAGFLLQFATVTTAILATLILKERWTMSKGVTLALILIGTLLLITKGRLDPPRIGDVILIFACLAWSLGNVLTRRILKTYQLDADVVSLFRPLFGLPLVLAAALASPLYPSQFQSSFNGALFDDHFLGYAFLNGLFAVLLWVFLNRTLQIASASYMTMMSALTPVLVALLSLAFLRENLAIIQWLGVMIIIFSSYATYILKIEKH